MCVVRRSYDDTWENLVKAHEEHVLLVLIDGQPGYGTKELMTACGARRTTAVSVGQARRRIVLVDPKDVDRLPQGRDSWTWTEVLERLDAVRGVLEGIPGCAEALAGRNLLYGCLPASGSCR